MEKKEGRPAGRWGDGEREGGKKEKEDGRKEGEGRRKKGSKWKERKKDLPKHGEEWEGQKFEPGAYLRTGNAFRTHFNNFRKSYSLLITIMNFLNSAFLCSYFVFE